MSDTSLAAGLQSSRGLQWCCATLLFYFPVTMLAVEEIGSVFFFLLALTGLIYVSVYRHDNRGVLDKRLVFAVVFYFAVALLSYLVSDINDIGLHRLERYARFLFFIPMALLLIRVNPSPLALWTGLACGGIVAGLVAMNEVWWHIGVDGEGRATGSVNPIIFGNLSMALALLNIASIEVFWRWARASILLPIAGASLAFIGSLLSGTRGSWIALLACLVFFAWKFLTQKQGKFYGVAVVFIVGAVIGAYLIPATGVSARTTAAVEEVKNYYNGTQIGSSIGERLQMWSASWKLFKEHPILGTGIGAYKEELKKLSERGLANAALLEYEHAHSEYFFSLASRGIFGLASLLVLLGLPLIYFVKASRSENPTQRSAANVGIVLIFAFADFGIGNSVFDRALNISFFTYCLAALVWIITDAQRVAATPPSAANPTAMVIS